MSVIDQLNERIQAVVDRLTSSRRVLLIMVIAIAIGLVLILLLGRDRRGSTPGQGATPDTPITIPDWRQHQDLPADTIMTPISGPGTSDQGEQTPDTKTDEWWQYSSQTDGLQFALPGTPTRSESEIQVPGEGWGAQAVSLMSVGTDQTFYAVSYQNASYLSDPDGADYFDITAEDKADYETITRLTVAGYPAAQTDGVDPETGQYIRTRTVILPERTVTLTAVSPNDQPPQDFDFFFNSLQIIQ
ncbi:hypothetical protein IJJ08_04375 [bacterium]|nr:hypothetical protein [bacterium]